MEKRSAKQSQNNVSAQKYTFEFSTLGDMAVATGIDLEKMLGNVGTQAWLLAFLSALIDPEGVRQAELTHTLPPSVHTALHLLSKLNFYFAGKLISPQASAEGQRMQQVISGHERSMIEREWRLAEGERFSLEQAVNPTTCPWCKYKTVVNLRKFLKNSGFPFSYFNRKPYVTEAAYQKALELDHQRRQKRDRERKSEIARGKSKLASGKNSKSPGKNRPTSGKLS
jgi:hypothetical protein